VRLADDVLRNLFRKPFTEGYPFAKADVAERFRGWIEYHGKKCIGCRLCEKNCPVAAIVFHEKGKIDFDMGKCILCGQCGDVCPTQAITYSAEFEHASKLKKFAAKEDR